MEVREVVGRAAITGSVAAVAFLTIKGLVNAFMARAAAMPRVAYQDGQYLVAVRGFGEWHDVRDFVQPHDLQVQAVVQQVGPDWWELYRYVCEEFDYRSEAVEYWEFPSEVLASGAADCEGTSILLASLLKAAGTQAYVVIGAYYGYGHAWVQPDNQILETTLTEPILVDDPQNYKPYFYFDDQVAVELWPGALEEALGMRRNGFAKMRLIGGT